MAKVKMMCGNVLKMLHCQRTHCSEVYEKEAYFKLKDDQSVKQKVVT